MTIEERNKKFKSMSHKEQRIAIAKDVILQLGKGKIQAAHVYFNFTKGGWDVFEKEAKSRKEVNLQSFLKQSVECEVCAKGALFFSSVRKRNDVFLDINFNGVHKEIIPSLTDIFRKSILNAIEDAYENGFYGYYKYPAGEKRMIAIMKNIVKNGDFVYDRDECREIYWINKGKRS